MNEPIKVASCIISDDYGRFLLLHRYATEESRWETPGGKVEEEETLEDAAVREMREELGIAVIIDVKLGTAVVELPDNDYEITWFRAKIVGGQPQVMEQDMFDDLEYFDIEDLPSLALSPGTLELHNMIFTGEVQL
jgi:mutator protein MutT